MLDTMRATQTSWIVALFTGIVPSFILPTLLLLLVPIVGTSFPRQGVCWSGINANLLILRKTTFARFLLFMRGLQVLFTLGLIVDSGTQSGDPPPHGKGSFAERGIMCTFEHSFRSFFVSVAGALIISSIFVTTAQADCPVRFTGSVSMPELTTDPLCVGNYYVQVQVYDILEDGCGAMPYTRGFPYVDVAYDQAQNFVSFDMVEVYGFACTNCAPRSCGMIDATQPSSEDYYITIMREANFSATPRTGLEPLEVDFTDSSTGPIDSWSWDFDEDGAEDSTERNPSYTFWAGPADHIYTVSLTVSGAIGMSHTETKLGYIRVLGLPNADFSASPISGTAPLCVSFTPHYSPGAIDTWSWDFNNDGVEDSAQQNPEQYCYELPGDYTVRLTVSGFCGSDTEIKTDYINAQTNPVIDNFRRRPFAPGDILKINGTNFGNGTSGFLHFGSVVLPSNHTRVKLWTPDQIKVRIPKAKYLKNECSWFQGKEAKKLKVWVSVGGLDSNIKRLELTRPADCQ